MVLLIVRPVIQLAFGEAFLPSIRPFMLLLPGIVLGTLASPLSLYFTQHIGRPRINAGASALGLLVNLALNAYWIPRHGAAGAAGASSVAYTLVALLLLWRFSREPGFRLSVLLIPRREDFQLLRDAVKTVVTSAPGRKRR
jgi:O-antigen/teichoic acid export membrane protein